MYVSISAGLLPDSQSLFNSGNGGLVILNQGLQPQRFRFHFQERLLEIQVHRKLVRQLERAAKICRFEFGLLSQNLKELGVELQGALSVRVRDLGGIVIKEENFTLEKRTFLIELNNLKSLSSLGVNVHAAIVIFFPYLGDDRGAAHFSQGILVGPDHAKGFLLFQTFSDHLFVARLKDVQREGRAREQHHVQREQRQKAHPIIL